MMMGFLDHECPPLDRRLLPGAAEELVQSRNDRLTLVAQGSHDVTESIHRHRHHFERVEHDGTPADLEGWIETCVPNFANRGRPHEWHDHPAPISVELGRLHYDEERDRIFVLPGIPVNVELGHQSDEYSSAIEPNSELKLFHVATVASTTFDL